MKCYICGSETDLKTTDGQPICLSCLDERRDVVCTDNGITYDGIKLDLENYHYWFEQAILKNIKEQDIKNYKIGQKLDIHEDDVLETIVTKLDYDYVQVEYFKRSSGIRSPIEVDDNGYDDHYDLFELCCDRDICFYRDTFILKGTRRNLVKEKDFSVDYDGGADGPSIQIGSMTLNFWTNQNKDCFCDGYDVLGWHIEEKDDCTILSVDIAGLFQWPGGYDYQGDDIDRIFENHWDVEDRFGQIVEEDYWDLISTYNGKCSVVVKFPWNRRYTYNYDGLISVDDRVRVSGKLSGNWGIVEEIGKYQEEPYMQNVVEVMESAGDEDDDDEWDDDDE